MSQQWRRSGKTKDRMELSLSQNLMGLIRSILDCQILVCKIKSHEPLTRLQLGMIGICPFIVKNAHTTELYTHHPFPQDGGWTRGCWFALVLIQIDAFPKDNFNTIKQCQF
jgi:hypothetical protein